MSAKYLHTIADENPNLQKQLGCMSGLFRLGKVFNRQHLVTGRQISSHGRKRLPPGESGNSGKEPNITIQKTTEKKLEGVKERERTSVESSRSSYSSSSCSSTFSSITGNKLVQPEASVLGQSPLSKTPSQVVPKKQPDPSLHLGQRSPNIRNIVKDSIQRETCELSIKTKTKPESKNRVMKHIDSPRPQQVFKPVNPRNSTPDRSSRVFNIKERNSAMPAKDAPRFSYDERESRDKWKSVTKLRELPRFSLDSRESSIRKAASEPRSNTLLEDLQQRGDQRLTSVVAKLMGLEAFPDPTDTIKCRPRENLDPISTQSLRKADENKHNQVIKSPKLAPRETLSPKLRNINSPAKSNPRFPLEPAPWRQTNGNQKSPPILYPSVYGQIEHRLTELEFKKSGNDLRALKQILGAMHKARENIEDKKDESSYKLNSTSSTENTPTIKGGDSPKKLEASIAIAQPAKVLQRPKYSASSPVPLEGLPVLQNLKTRKTADTKKELISRKNKYRESPQRSLRPMAKRSSAATYTSKKTSVSPRMQHNKHGLEKKSPRITTSEASTPRRAVDQHHTETFSPSRKCKPKSSVQRQGDDDHLSEISSEAICLSHQGDIFSACSESNLSTASQNDEVTSNYRSEVSTSLDEFRSTCGTKPTTFEQPSPVSVLDTTFYPEESPSPVKKISSAFTDEDNLSSDEALSNPVDLVDFLNTTRPNLVSEFEGEKLENIEHLNHKLKKVNSHDEADADSIATICESMDPMYTYVAEILSASGLFKDLSTSSTFTQLHPSGHLINPHLFHILEQSKSKVEAEDDEQSNGKMNKLELHEKTPRKLIFDTTDEILVHILISAGFADPWISPNKLGRRSLTGKKLLEKICVGMNRLQNDPECSLPYEDDEIHSEIPGIVLEIERLIFKDLISEIVSGEAGLPSRLNRHRRQLFTN